MGCESVRAGWASLPPGGHGWYCSSQDAIPIPPPAPLPPLPAGALSQTLHRKDIVLGVCFLENATQCLQCHHH